MTRIPRHAVEPSAEAIADYIRGNLRLAPAPGVAEIRLFQAHPGSGLARFVGRTGRSPYWAFGWAGGTVLARYILDRPELVGGRQVADLGTGSGLVAIAAARAGAGEVTAIDHDPVAVAAAGINALENAATITVRRGDALAGPPPEVDVVTVGDLFYDPALAVRTLAFLEACAAARRTVLIGDPGRRHLPRDRLQVVFEAEVPDFDGRGTGPAAVYALR